MSETEPLQRASIDFFLPVAAAYLAVCVCWIVVRRWAGPRWQSEPVPETDAKWLDLLMVPLAIIGVLGLGDVFRRGWLLPVPSGEMGRLVTAVNLLIPFAPQFVILAVRRQSLQTVWLSRRALGWKLLTGMISAVVGAFVFLVLRGELARLPAILGGIAAPGNAMYAPAVFMEAVAVAFVFVRLRWAFGTGLSLLIPCLLFAAAHVPRSIQSGSGAPEIALFVVFNTGLAMAIFATVMRSRDVVWIAIPHYVIDIAIEAFA